MAQAEPQVLTQRIDGAQSPGIPTRVLDLGNAAEFPVGGRPGGLGIETPADVERDGELDVMAQLRVHPALEG
jgi:hypothetical protein